MSYCKYFVAAEDIKAGDLLSIDDNGRICRSNIKPLYGHDAEKKTNNDFLLPEKLGLFINGEKVDLTLNESESNYDTGWINYKDNTTFISSITRYKISGTEEQLNDIKYKTDRYGYKYIDLEEEEKEELQEKGIGIEEYVPIP